MFIFYSCADYLRSIATAPADCTDVPERCRRLEVERNDGFAVFAVRDSRIVADGEGWTVSEGGCVPSDAATATGMYDAW